MTPRRVLMKQQTELEILQNQMDILKAQILDMQKAIMLSPASPARININNNCGFQPVIMSPNVIDIDISMSKRTMKRGIEGQNTTFIHTETTIIGKKTAQNFQSNNEKMTASLEEEIYGNDEQYHQGQQQFPEVNDIIPPLDNGRNYRPLYEVGSTTELNNNTSSIGIRSHDDKGNDFRVGTLTNNNNNIDQLLVKVDQALTSESQETYSHHQSVKTMIGELIDDPERSFVFKSNRIHQQRDHVNNFKRGLVQEQHRIVH